MPRKKRETKIMVTESLSDNDEELFSDDQSNSSRSFQQPQHRNAANARERARMRVLSKAFSRLKTKLPWVPPDTKLSKLDTLRLAASYIGHLRAVLADDPQDQPPSLHPLNLTWPFSFQHSSAGSAPVISSPLSQWGCGQTIPPQNIAVASERRDASADRYPHPELSHGDQYDKMDPEYWYQNIQQRDDAYVIRHAFSETMIHIG